MASQPAAGSQGLSDAAHNNTWRKSGLWAAARDTGSFVGQIRYPAIDPASIGELIALSSNVFVGNVESNEAHATRDGMSIVTVYHMTILTNVIGQAGKNMDVAVLGGRIGFVDGSTAELVVPGLQRPVDGERLMCFVHVAPADLVLESYGTASKAYVPSAGPLGLYDLAPTHSLFIMPAGFYRSRLATYFHAAKLNSETAMKNAVVQAR